MSSGKKQAPPPSAQPAIQAVNTPSFFEQMAEKKAKQMFDWEESGPRDILAAPGMEDALDIYGTAESLEQKKRMSNPMQALSGPASGNYAAQLEDLNKRDRYDQRASGLSSALQGAKNQAYGLAADSSQMDMQRRTGYANLMLGQENAYYNRPKKKPLWERIAGFAIGGANAAAKAMTGAG